MRRLIWHMDGGDLAADLGDDGTWTCDDPLMRQALDMMTDSVLSEIGPADGFPLAAAFHEVARRIGPDKVIYSVPVSKTPDDITP